MGKAMFRDDATPTAREARRLLVRFLCARGIAYGGMRARTVSFLDLARQVAVMIEVEIAAISVEDCAAMYDFARQRHFYVTRVRPEGGPTCQ
jgi:hypothetical protein